MSREKKKELPPKYIYLRTFRQWSKLLAMQMEIEVQGLYVNNPPPPHKVPKFFLYDDADIDSLTSYINNLLCMKSVIKLLNEAAKEGIEKYNCPIASEMQPIGRALFEITEDSIDRAKKLMSNLEKKENEVQNAHTAYLESDPLEGTDPYTLGFVLHKLNVITTQIESKITDPYGNLFFDIQKTFAVQLDYFIKDLLVITTKAEIEARMYIDGGQVALTWPKDKEQIFNEIAIEQTKGKDKSAAVRAVIDTHPKLDITSHFHPIRTGYNRSIEAKKKRNKI
jgi:hypothetical protein